ncbi:DUF2341 domain-containing protein [Thermococcus camini]|uniref:DUF2341 domain-containing protein n=1 Tax=Thermococcus camini TaxID=2016373 RepID=A0A7G2D8C8_9EURY|nr:DUF2341 domain-containing protein [Thermococcus camini]CAD5243405.1 conserved protein of unknown function [Thermococcus camini]
MRRRAYIINSTVILLIIPLILLLATYEDVSSQIVFYQSERMQVERTYRVVSYIEMDFQRTLEISGKRAVVTVVDYIASTGNFLSASSSPANITIRDLMLVEEAQGVSQQYADKLMKDQTVFRWLLNISSELDKQGYTLEVDDTAISDVAGMSRESRKEFLRKNVDITVAPLDSFRIVVKARINNVKIYDSANNVVYQGTIPRDGYVYSIVSIEELEDPMFSALTGGRYFRSIRPCNYTYPELIDRPIKVLYGDGASNVYHYPGVYSKTTDLGNIFFGNVYPGDGASAYVIKSGTPTDPSTPMIVNTSLTEGGDLADPSRVFKTGDLGVLAFDETSGSGSTNWCSGLEYRLNITVTNNAGEDLDDYQIPILLSTAKGFSPQLLRAIFRNTQASGEDPYTTNASIRIYDSNCNPVPFWIEYWDVQNRKALIWIRTSIPRRGSTKLQLYFGNSAEPVKGNGEDVFIFFEDFNRDTIDSTKWTNTSVAGDNGHNTGPGTWTVENGILKSDTSNKAYGLVSIRTFAAPIIIEARMRNNPRDLDNDVIGVLFAFQKWDEFYGALIDYGDTGWGASTSLVADSLDWQERFNDDTARTTPKNGNWHIVKVEFYRPGYARYYLDNTLISDKHDAQSSYSQGAVGLVSGYMGGGAHFDWIFVRKYPSIDPDISYATIEQYSQSQTTVKTVPARAYDLQPFVECLMDQRYFGTYSGWSFFERLENSNRNHEGYVRLAKRMQDEMGIKYGNEYYPIGLVSFTIPHRVYDEKLFNIFVSLQIAPEEGVSSADYNFLNHYFKSRDVISSTGYRVWGISYEDPNNPNPNLHNPREVPFFMDYGTAVAIFGAEGANDLLKR